MVPKKGAAAAAVAAALGIGLLVLQRWVAETRFAAIVLVSVWFALVGGVVLAVAWRDRELRLPALGTYAAIALASAGIGYWTGFRDHRVDEQVVMASEAATGAEKTAGLAAAPPVPTVRVRRPVAVVAGRFDGKDGHDGSGVATVVRKVSGARTLTFTKFDVSPGVKVEVYLTRDESSIGDRIELGDLKGNVGNQQYSIPKTANLADYDTVVLYCTPFTVRIATAPLA